ncbi:hypothetical protein [Sphingopyxis sp. KK2]|uniref:hypothetical protein n=1 Tax=Sphingopyxis sp. KK2 TaxID=1855727 RepID=UPI0009FB554C|nr:hypothetical protein [Sphingopyxis sp. KK2]
MTAARVAASARRFLPALFYIGTALLLGWIAGGQMAFGRIDAALAIPLLMPGALWLAWAVRDERGVVRLSIIFAALLGLTMIQFVLHHLVGHQIGGIQLLATAALGVLSCALAVLAMRVTRSWHAAWRWATMLPVVMLWFVAGQAVIGIGSTAPAKKISPKLAILTGLPLRWQGDDLAAMLASGPSDAPALAALRQRFDFELVDSVAQLPDGALLFIAHPRALAPEELVRIDALTAQPRTIVILADALSSWEPPYALGDPRNPPVTSLLTPLLDHWGVTLAAPDPARAGDVDVFIDPAGQKLRLHSAGRFTRLPAQCATWGDRRVARCPIGKASVWLVGDADLLHESLWQSPIPDAPWLARSDNMKWLVSVMGGPGKALFEPIWIR